MYPQNPLVSEQPRLLFCCFDVLPGPNGLSRRITEYLKGLADRFQVVVLSTKTPDHSHIERYHGARLLRVPVGGGDLQSRIQAFDRAVRRQLESEEYVLAHFFDPFGGYALCDSRAQYGFRLVYDAQSFPSQELRFTHPSTEGDRRFLSKVRRQELYCLMNADAVVCGSEVTRDWVLSLGAPPMSLHVYPQPVDPAPYTEEMLGKPDGTPMKLLHLGSQLPYQGLSTLLRAMQLALRQVDLRLMIVGPKVPDGQAPFDDLVQELKLTGKVEFLPPVTHDELPKTLAMADVGVLTLDESDRNRSQGGPCAKVAEYLAAGRPVITSDLPVTRELVPEAARMLFPPGDFKLLAELLVQLAGDTAARVKLGEAARESALKFDAATVRGKLLHLYEQLSTRGKTLSPSEAQTEVVTELRKTGSSDTGRGVVRPAEERPPGETIDEEEPAVVVGEQLEQKEKPEDRLRAAVTDPAMSMSSGAPEPTPIVKAKRKRKGGTDEHTPIGPPPEIGTEPTPITSARSRRVISKTGNKAPPAEWPETPPPEPTPIGGPAEAKAPEPEPPAPPPPPPAPPPSAPTDGPPVRIRRTTEGKGVRSPFAPPPPPSAPTPVDHTEPPAVTAENPVPAAEAPVRIKRSPESKGAATGEGPPPPPPPPIDPGPSVIVEMDAGLPRLKRGEEVRGGPATHQIPVLTPSGEVPIVAAPAPAPAPASAPAPVDELPRIIKRGPEQKSVRATEQIPVLVPQAPPPEQKSTRATESTPVLTPQAPAPEQKRAAEQIPVLTPPPPSPGQIPPPSLASLPPPPLPPPPMTQPITPPPAEEPMEISNDEIESVEEEAPRVTVPMAAAGATIDPWVAQLLFGYCPPEAVPFERPAPPTTFPGRDP